MPYCSKCKKEVGKGKLVETEYGYLCASCIYKLLEPIFRELGYTKALEIGDDSIRLFK